MDGEEVTASPLLEWNKREHQSGPGVWDIWEAKTPQAHYLIVPRLRDSTRRSRQRNKPWTLVVELFPLPPKLNSEQRRKQRRLNPFGPKPERRYSLPCKTQEQAKQIAVRHATTQSCSELNQLEQQAPLHWGGFDGFGPVFMASTNNSTYALDVKDGMWFPSFWNAEQEEDGPPYTSLEAAKSACEHHRVTGEWQ